MDPNLHPHQRWNPLLDEWVLVSPHRTERPWQGQTEFSQPSALPSYDASCYLCPGNSRAGDLRNPDYSATYVFANDFPALLPDSSFTAEESDLIRSMPTSGECRVICFSPRHDLTMAEMSVAEISEVVSVWVNQDRELGPNYRWVQIFENKGVAMGCSNPHAHGQVWASDFVPSLVAREDVTQRAYFERKSSPMLSDYLALELVQNSRVVCENGSWAFVVPFWATWPYEMLLLPKQAVARLRELSIEQQGDLADILKQGLTRYDNLFETSFPYSMGWHGAPNDGGPSEHWTLHAHFYPPLLRSETVKKFMVGYEMLAQAQRDITPEQAAERLRAVSEDHYKQR
ncbi:MAG: UDP-glucose--hexose-1-phosphate uridylyltransferase [Armatimonadetes bacterium]|nr:UDP-glucose--hexose-1-phosphate uridylyltransferase [Armatimonadota bacterium]